jgi:hypothetical protein
MISSEHIYRDKPVTDNNSFGNVVYRVAGTRISGSEAAHAVFKLPTEKQQKNRKKVSHRPMNHLWMSLSFLLSLPFF